MGIFYSDPYTTHPENQYSEIAVPIKGDVKPEGNIKVKDLSPMDVASISFKGPAEEIYKTYRTLCDWMKNNGYEWAGPAIEVYPKEPETIERKTIHYIEIQAVVKKI